jgi:hypothetical protein
MVLNVVLARTRHPAAISVGIFDLNSDYFSGSIFGKYFPFPFVRSPTPFFVMLSERGETAIALDFSFAK